MSKEEENQEEKPIYFPEEINYMLDERFLPKIQKIAKRAKEIRFPDEDIYAYRLNLVLQFKDIEGDLKYENIKDHVNIQLQPITQKSVDEALKKQVGEKKNENS
ncbi:MAG: hypothetical protein ACLFUW_00350 [Bacteroidales bacterium]